jgi:fumarate reductase subunit C
MTTESTSGKRRPYVRAMDGWWRKNPYFVEYMIHEGTALFVAAYAVILLVGLFRLSQGEAAWNAWLMALRSPLSILAHLVLLAALLYHAWTWFKIMPRTLPPIRIDGKRVSPAAITGAGLLASAIGSLIVLGLVWGLTR